MTRDGERRAFFFRRSCDDSGKRLNCYEPEFNDGDIIIISPTAKAVTGDYVVAKNDEEEAAFKQYKRFDKTKVLHPLNPRYNDVVLNKDKEYRIVGVVMEKKKRYK